MSNPKVRQYGVLLISLLLIEGEFVQFISLTVFEIQSFDSIVITTII